MSELPPMPWHILRLWLLFSLATLLAGLLLAPAPVRADGFSHASLVMRDEREPVACAWIRFGEDQIGGV